MWHGGVRVAVFDGDGRVLLVRHHYEGEGRDVWMLPGGAIEEGETSADAAIREVLEETGLIVHVGRLFWHIEEVSGRGQRFVNFFLAEVIGGRPEVGEDPELGSEQVLEGMAFFDKEGVRGLENVYPENLKDELWDELIGGSDGNIYRIRK